MTGVKNYQCIMHEHTIIGIHVECIILYFELVVPTVPLPIVDYILGSLNLSGQMECGRLVGG